jgi:hypothetical protein
LIGARCTVGYHIRLLANSPPIAVRFGALQQPEAPASTALTATAPAQQERRCSCAAADRCRDGQGECRHLQCHVQRGELADFFPLLLPSALSPAAGLYEAWRLIASHQQIPVYEYQFGVDLKEHVMRRRQDDWINATHILKAAGFDKPARTRILEREVQKDIHEKIQGGYGKYQGTFQSIAPIAPELFVQANPFSSRNMDPPRTRRGSSPSQQHLRPPPPHLRVPAWAGKPPARTTTHQQAQSPAGQARCSKLEQ